MYRIKVNLLLVCLCALCSSCTLFHPLPLDPIKNTEPVQELDPSGLWKLNGDYENLTADSNYTSLGMAIFYYDRYDKKNKHQTIDYIQLKAIDGKHLEAIMFGNGKKIKSRTIKGKVVNNYFEFHSTHLKFRFIINVYEQQMNRLALSKEGALFLDNNHGGIAFLVFMPIPLSGASQDTYNLRFKRKRSIRS